MTTEIAGLSPRMESYPAGDDGEAEEGAVSVSSPVVPAEQRVVLRDVPWEVYEALLGDHPTRLTYDRGVLELMSPGKRHEKLALLVNHLVLALVSTWGGDVEGAGATTFRVEQWERGFEPDACFWFSEAERVRRMDEVDPERWPPDLVLEVDISRSSLDKLGMLARFRIPEVWRHDGRRAEVLVLAGDEYRSVEESVALPGLTATVLTDLLAAGLQAPLPAWEADVRAWATTARRGGGGG